MTKASSPYYEADCVKEVTVYKQRHLLYGRLPAQVAEEVERELAEVEVRTRKCKLRALGLDLAKVSRNCPYSDS